MDAKSFARTTLFKALGIVLGLLLICLPSFSQLNFGRILGGITDSSGGVVPNATVTITDVQRNVSRALTTDQAGEYNAPSLIPGIYTVRVEAMGFQAIERQNVAVEVGHDVRVDLTLQPGAQTQTVTVTEAIPIINTTNSVISSTVESQTLSDLPLSGRLYTKMLDLTPGVAGHPGGNSPDYSSNGADTTANNFMLDGITNTNAFIDSGPLIGAATSNDELTIVPLDAIQEVNVMSNPTAEFGWEQGAVVNVGLKSGTNSIHGTAYAFGRDTAMDAQNPYLNSPPVLPKADDYFEQFGASIGGPIKKDKLFYFGNYEGMRYIVGSPGVVSIPSSLSGSGPGGSFPDAIAALSAAHVPLSQLSLNLAGCTAAGACDPTQGVFKNGTTNSAALPSSLDNTGGSNNAVFKLDYHLSDRNSIHGVYFFGQARTLSNGQGVEPYWDNNNWNRTQAARVVWVYTPNSTWVNEARFGYNRYNLLDGNEDCFSNSGAPNFATAFGFVSGVNAPAPVCGFPVTNIGSFASLGAGEFISDQVIFQDRFAVVDSVSYTRGKHLIKFGIEIDRAGFHGGGLVRNADGTINFNGGATPGVADCGGASCPLEDFLAGNTSGGSVLVGLKSRNLGFDQYAGFVQDDWRITPRLTLNLGLRFEYEPALVAANNSFGNFDASAPSGMVQQASGQSFYRDSHDFGPRLGFAWDVTGKGTTVVRGGASILYDTTGLGYFVSTLGANLPAMPTGFTLVNASGATVPSPGNISEGIVGANTLSWVCNSTSSACPGAPATVTPVFNAGPSGLTCGNGVGTNPPPCDIAGVDPNYHRSPLFIWTLGIQHAFTNSLSLNVAYVGTHATGMVEILQLNQPVAGVATNLSNQFPWFGQIFQGQSPVGFENYNALQTTVTERASHGLTIEGEYTWSHALNSGGGGANAFVENSYEPQLMYGNNMDIPFQHLSVTLSYQIPGIKSPGQLLQGWVLNNAINWLGARPFNGSDGIDDLAMIGSGTGLLRGPQNPGLQWTLTGPVSNFNKLGLGTANQVIPCFSAPGGSFAGFGCSTNTASPEWQACLTAAGAEASEPSLPGSSGVASLMKFGCYATAGGGSVIVPPAAGTFGTMGHNMFTSVPFFEWDLSVSKTWKFKERLSAEFRADFFNVTNTRGYNAPVGEISNPAIFGTSQNTPNFSNPINGTGGPREVQLGLKLSF